MEYQWFFCQKAILNNYFIEYIEEENKTDETFKNLLNFINSHFKESPDEFKIVLHLINKMTKNHNRNFFLFKKIHRILLINEDYIRQTFSNSAIYNIFKNNKLMLLFLFEKKIIVDISVLEILKHQYYHRSYSDFFYNSKLIFKCQQLFILFFSRDKFITQWKR